MKDRFTTAEWAQLERVPFLVCQYVAMANGPIRSKAETEFAWVLWHFKPWEPLETELFAELRRWGEDATVQEYRDSSTSISAMDREIVGIRTSLKAKLSSEEYNRFFYAIFSFATLVANRAGEAKKTGLLRRRQAEPTMSDTEAEALGVLTVEFDVEPEAGRQAFLQLDLPDE